MATATATAEREHLLKLSEAYRKKGYEVILHPSSDDLPAFLRPYRPDMVVRREGEAVVIEVKSRSSLTSSGQYLQNLARSIEQHPEWRFELVLLGSDHSVSPPFNAQAPLQAAEIASRLQVARQLISQNLDSALLYTWSLAEATLRLVAENEMLVPQQSGPLPLLKQLTIEGIISRAEYRLLTDIFSQRNAVAHGFKVTDLTPDTIRDLAALVEQMLEDVGTGEEESSVGQYDD